MRLSYSDQKLISYFSTKNARKGRTAFKKSGRSFDRAKLQELVRGGILIPTAPGWFLRA